MYLYSAELHTFLTTPVISTLFMLPLRSKRKCLIAIPHDCPCLALSFTRLRLYHTARILSKSQSEENRKKKREKNSRKKKDSYLHLLDVRDNGEQKATYSSLAGEKSDKELMQPLKS